jgi:hypothetical protein
MIVGLHMGRGWAGHLLEDDCLCAQAPCGLVISGQRDPSCTQHTNDKSIRQQHSESDCPALCPGAETSPNRCTCPCAGCRHHCSAHQWPDRCAHCGLEVEDRGDPNMGGPAHVKWVHTAGGYTVCFPQRGADSPRAEPEKRPT